MATTTTPRPTQGRPDPGDRRLGRERPVGGGELWLWLFMRISGLILMVLALGHLVIMHLLGTGAERINFGFVAVRWASPFWRTWDWMLLMLALVHGINGLRNITLDYVTRAGAPPRDQHDVVRDRIHVDGARHGHRRDVRPIEVARSGLDDDDPHVRRARRGWRRRRDARRDRALRPGQDRGRSRSSTPPGHTPALRRAACAPRSATPRRTTRSGTHSTRSRAATTSSISRPRC